MSVYKHSCPHELSTSYFNFVPFFNFFTPLSLSIIIFLRGGYGIRCIDNDMLIIIDVEHKLYLLSLMDRDDINPSIYGSC